MHQMPQIKKRQTPKRAINFAGSFTEVQGERLFPWYMIYFDKMFKA